MPARRTAPTGARSAAGPDDLPDEKLARGFGHNTAVAMFERRGFKRQRPIAKNRWVVVRAVAAA